MIQSSFHGMRADEFQAYPVRLAGDRAAMLEHLAAHLTVNPLATIRYRCNPDWRLPPRTLQNSYCTMLLRGQGTAWLADKNYQVAPGDLILFPEGIRHAFEHPAGETLEMINIHFHAKVYNLMDFIQLQELSGVLHDAGGFAAAAAGELARIFALKPPCYQLVMTQLIKSLLLYAAYHFPGGAATGMAGLKQLLKLFPALELIERRLTDPELKLAELASTLRLSEVYLRQMFNRRFHESPIKFIHHRRIELACKLLRESDWPVKAVAENAGFRDLQFFYRVFGRITGMTPASYRNASDFC